MLIHSIIFISVLPSFFDEQFCLANVVWHEARGEPLAGQTAVLEVVRNRQINEKSSACKVIKRKGQFSWVKDKGFSRVTFKMAQTYVLASLNSNQLKDKKYIYFSRGYQYGHSCRRIGSHLFCKA